MPTRLLIGTVLTASLSWAARPEAQPFTCLDLQPQANQKLDKPFHEAPDESNTLSELPLGKQELDGVTFEIGASVIQLGSTVLKDMPEAVEGISVNKAFKTLHVLQASGCSFSDKNTVIGCYVIHYADKSRESFEIVYGQDVYDWWFSPDEEVPARANVAWKGDNESAKNSNKRLRHFHSTWKNPNPDKKVASIDFLAAEGTTSAPFCVALTVE